MSWGLLGTGYALPPLRVANRELERRLGLPSGWIARRTGVMRRPVAAPNQATSDLAVQAGRAALENAGVLPTRVGLVLLATSTPDHPLPPTAPAVAAQLACHGAGAVDITGACAGFLYALSFADSHCRVQMASATRDCVLVIGANVLSRRVDAQDAATVSVFGDGAGALVWGPRPDLADPSALVGGTLAADGRQPPDPIVTDGGSRRPINADTFATGGHLMRIRQGGSLFRNAVRAMVDAGQAAMTAADLTPADIDHFLPHQANRRVLVDVARKLAFPLEKTIITVDTFANSSAATIPLALAHALAKDRVRPGQRVLMTAIGAGLISAGAILTV